MPWTEDLLSDPPLINLTTFEEAFKLENKVRN